MHTSGKCATPVCMIFCVHVHECILFITRGFSDHCKPETRLQLNFLVTQFCCRDWRSSYIDLHGYGHWSCQLALLAGLRNMYHKFMSPDWRWPNSDLVVSLCSCLLTHHIFAYKGTIMCLLVAGLQCLLHEICGSMLLWCRHCAKERFKHKCLHSFSTKSPAVTSLSEANKVLCAFRLQWAKAIAVPSGIKDLCEMLSFTSCSIWFQSS